MMQSPHAGQLAKPFAAALPRNLPEVDPPGEAFTACQRPATAAETFEAYHARQET
jgi:hypothetical protein